jgi:hypothetical protein
MRWFFFAHSIALHQTSMREFSAATFTCRVESMLRTHQKNLRAM